MMRTPELLRDGDDAVALIMCLGGRADIRFGDDTAVLLPGQAILMPHHRPGGSMWHLPRTPYTLRMERDVARRIVPSIEAALLRTTAPGDPAFAILSAYCGQLMALASALPGATATLAGAQLEELIGALAGPSQRASNTPAAPVCAPRASRRSRTTSPAISTAATCRRPCWRRATT